MNSTDPYMAKEIVTKTFENDMKTLVLSTDSPEPQNEISVLHAKIAELEIKNKELINNLNRYLCAYLESIDSEVWLLLKEENPDLVRRVVNILRGKK